MKKDNKLILEALSVIIGVSLLMAWIMSESQKDKLFGLIVLGIATYGGMFWYGSQRKR
jgi:hypothetical protein